ncbi:hypothetical protein [Porcincola intestinalis]|uniref:hypothetical protein n=1 Tax=Porcincola intestinalis TaxID=2606632 RepID=UPI0023F0FA51|nr:hypothetical protein [Porcincola intestinalis]MCI6767638.1 hypothetical protein [Lachnospiraceae bacterium]MDD7060502.1 hypothetical protein [Porcincola intestinalis]MDY5282523.1 hypothetical protein [Porcincola intestinalis]
MSGTNMSGYCVTCLRCGKIHQKGYAADAIFICPKCGYENYVFLRYGVQIEMPADLIHNEQFLTRVRKFAVSLERLAGAEQEDIFQEEMV